MRKGKGSGKKAVAMTAAAAMALSMLGGCGTGGEKAEDGGTSTSGEDAFQFESVSDVKFPLKEKLTLDVFVYATTTGGGTYQDNYVTDWIEEKTNIHLNFVYDVDGDDAKTKLNLVMTDPDSMPDIFWATNWTKSEVLGYGKQGLLLPLNEYLKDAPNWNALNEASPGREKDITMTDGNIYTYGDDNECFHCLYQNRMWIYKPWVEQLNGGKMPETIEELYDYMVKIKTQDPNGNGKNDEIPMSGYLGGWSTDPTVWMLNSFLQCNNPLSNTNPTIGAGLVINDGKIEYSVMKDEYKEGLEFINKLYQEGLLDPQTFTQDDKQFQSALTGGDPLIGLAPGGTIMAEGDKLAAHQEGKWQDWEILAPVEGPDGVRLAAKGVTSYFGSAVGSISANCKYPEIAVALFDFLASEEATNVQTYGPEGYGWQWTEEGTALDDGTPKYESLGMADADEFDWIGNGFEKEYANKNYVSDAMFRCSTKDFRGALKVDDPELDGEYILQKAAELYEQYSPSDENIVPNVAFSDADAQQLSQYTLTIGGYVNQAAVQFITGELNIEKDWDTYLQKLESMGVEDYLSMYQKAYEEYMNN